MDSELAPDHDPERVDLELATDHYGFKNIAQWVRAGFLIYARIGGANLHCLLDQWRITPKILSL